MLCLNHTGTINTPGAEVLERPPDGEASASDLDRLQHARVSELVQDHGLVEMVRHLGRKNNRSCLNVTFS